MNAKMTSILAGLLGLLGVFTAAPAWAQAPFITYQGRLQQGGAPVSGPYDLKFELFTSATLGSSLNVREVPGVAVANGIFSADLAFQAGSFQPGAERWLEISVRPNAGAPYTKLSPRQPVGSVPVAYHAALAAAVADGSVNANGLANNSVSAAKLADGSVITVKLAEGAVTASKLGAGAVGTAALADNAVSSAKIANGAVTNPKLADASVTTGKIADGAVTGGKIPGGQVVKSLNGLRDDVTLAAGANVSLTPNGNTLTISSSGGAAAPEGLKMTPKSVTTGIGVNATTRSAANVVLGYSANLVSDSVFGASVIGGGYFISPNAIGPGIQPTDALNRATGNYATAIGGAANTASGDYGFAAGSRAQALHSGAWVWSDPSAGNFASTGPNQFLVRASGGFGLNTSTIISDLTIEGDGYFSQGITVDGGNFGRNAVAAGLRFGFGSGEGIGSNRDGNDAARRYGLDFYTSFAPRLTIVNSGAVGIGTTTPQDSILDVEGDMHINDRAIFLRGGSDRNHALTYRGSFAGRNIDGPALFGWSGGALGTQSGGEKVALSWDSTGEVRVKVLTIEGGADLAEPFAMAEHTEPGSVMVIDPENPGALKLASEEYDSRVAGVVSGAGGVQPGIALRQAGVLDQGKHVALSGRVYVLADASEGPIRPGDLLTTSATPGHAMKARDRGRAPGAVLGKAMTALDSGRGLVLTLVSLQ